MPCITPQKSSAQFDSLRLHTVITFWSNAIICTQILRLIASETSVIYFFTIIYRPGGKQSGDHQYMPLDIPYIYNGPSLPPDIGWRQEDESGCLKIDFFFRMHGNAIQCTSLQSLLHHPGMIQNKQADVVSLFQLDKRDQHTNKQTVTQCLPKRYFLLTCLCDFAQRMPDMLQRWVPASGKTKATRTDRIRWEDLSIRDFSHAPALVLHLMSRVLNTVNYLGELNQHNDSARLFERAVTWQLCTLVHLRVQHTVQWTTCILKSISRWSPCVINAYCHARYS